MKGKGRTRKYFTIDQANATLPLVRAIVGDIAELTRSLRERQDRLSRLQATTPRGMGDVYREELDQARAEFDRDQERLADYAQELAGLGVELKDCDTGLVDFLSRMNGREVYLCWRLGEPEVEHWHELQAGFAGRKKLTRSISSST
jgi:hypothetical protein